MSRLIRWTKRKSMSHSRFHEEPRFMRKRPHEARLFEADESHYIYYMQYIINQTGSEQRGFGAP